ncbi:hypothetical protein PENTCL1PPCAC_5527, partial [Pristionchus entomophagus]
ECDSSLPNNCDVISGSGATCDVSTNDPATDLPGFGCCPATTTTVLTTTTAAAAVTSCMDLLNPLTGVCDCPARASLCTDSVYLEVMRVQCRRTCGFCTNSTSTNSTSTCVDLTNPSTGISDCPAR